MQSPLLPQTTAPRAEGGGQRSPEPQPLSPPWGEGPPLGEHLAFTGHGAWHSLVACFQNHWVVGSLPGV